MRPTFSIIGFTVLSGMGYGLLFLTAVSIALGAPLADHALPLALGAVLTIAGLLSSTAHLGRPARAWRAFSQWRSSWLSREGAFAVVTFAPLFALAWLIVTAKQAAGVALASAVLLAAGCTATVFCTARIYSSLAPIRAWHNRYVMPLYLLLSLYSGALWSAALGVAGPLGSMLPIGAVLLALVCAVLKWRYWRWLDGSPAASDTGAATGLDRLGRVRSLEQPHTEENYLTHEMGFVLARKHARKLRAIAFWLIVCAPAAGFLLGLAIGRPAAWIAVAAGALGLFVERWLFFAEARHTVIAYYGR